MIKTERTYFEKTVNRVYDLINSAHFSTFPIQVEIGNLLGVDHLELMIHTPCHASRDKYTKRLADQREILAGIGITDDTSANRYMDTLEPQLEAWSKLKDAFDAETEARLKGLQSYFVNGGHP